MAQAAHLILKNYGLVPGRRGWELEGGDGRARDGTSCAHRAIQAEREGGGGRGGEGRSGCLSLDLSGCPSERVRNGEVRKKETRKNSAREVERNGTSVRRGALLGNGRDPGARHLGENSHPGTSRRRMNRWTG